MAVSTTERSRSPTWAGVAALVTNIITTNPKSISPATIS